MLALILQVRSFSLFSSSEKKNLRLKNQDNLHRFTVFRWEKHVLRGNVVGTACNWPDLY